MAIVLGENRYGKSRVRVMKVTRDGAAHHVNEWDVEVWLQGDFTECFKAGDNSRVLPTDTMKNTVYSLARASSAVTIEDFGKELVTHFIESDPHAGLAGVRILSTPWRHIEADGETYATAFTHDGDSKETTVVTYSRDSGILVVSGFEEKWLLKTANSAFHGFLKDRLTTLKETSDRLFGTLAKAEWQYSGTELDYKILRPSVQSSLLKAFARHDSLSVQQTLYAMAEAALNDVSEISEIKLSMPNKHCNLVDLSPFDQDNPNLIFVPTDEPHGSIEAIVRRDA
jgi:urate oxidase